VCAECYDLVGFENGILDGVYEENDPSIIKDVNDLYNAIKAKGGKPSFQYMSMIKEA
jgi:hypothetical protein